MGTLVGIKKSESRTVFKDGVNCGVSWPNVIRLHCCYRLAAVHFQDKNRAGRIERSYSRGVVMAFDEGTAVRIREHLKRRRGFAEKKMFGGVGFLHYGNMCCGAWKEYLILRVGPKAYAQALTEYGAHEFDITGRPMKGWVMKGWVMISPRGFEHDDELHTWIDKAICFVKTLPKKPEFE